MIAFGNRQNQYCGLWRIFRNRLENKLQYFTKRAILILQKRKRGYSDEDNSEIITFPYFIKY